MKMRMCEVAAPPSDRPLFGPGSESEARAQEEARRYPPKRSPNSASGYRGVTYNASAAPRSRFVAQVTPRWDPTLWVTPRWDPTLTHLSPSLR